MKDNGLRRLLRLCGALLAPVGAAAAAVCAINAYMVLSVRPFVYEERAAVPARYTAVVLGARAYRDGSVSHVFRDRIAGGMALLEDGTVQKVLVSGDHGRKEYDEVGAALAYITRMYADADQSRIFLDHAGFSTYETMYRARDVFRVTDAVVVTQRFHICRALYAARKLGIDAVGYVPPELAPFSRRQRLWWEARESLARVKMFCSVLLGARPTYLGDALPITGDGRTTRD